MLVSILAKVSFKSPTEKISLLLVVNAEVKSSLAFDKILPEFVSEVMVVIVASELENISALAWLVIDAMLMVLLPNDLIDPELSRLVAVKVESPAL